MPVQYSAVHHEGAVLTRIRSTLDAMDIAYGLLYAGSGMREARTSTASQYSTRPWFSRQLPILWQAKFRRTVLQAFLQ